VRVPGLKTLRLSARWLRGRLTRGILILGYHSIAEPVTDAYSLSVTPQRFAEQLQVLSQIGQVISLRELVSRLRERRVPKRAVVLTFDDGYADVLDHAKPLLERYQTPATVFVTTGSLGREFWWDKLGRILFSVDGLAEQLSLQVRGGSYEWVSGNPSQRPASGSRRHTVQSIYQSLLPLSPVEREKVLVQLWAWAGMAPDDRPSRRALKVDELLELAAGDLVDIGAHTVTHPVLADLPIEAQRAEIQDSKSHLEEILGRPVTCFAYPNGSSSQGTLAIVRESGYSCACASHKDIAWRGSDPFRLPRLWVGNWDGKAFSRRVRLWLST
jgi:peptidoglycan/xylan/chitin deacetylase (PgdA/CDA1 family)